MASWGISHLNDDGCIPIIFPPTTLDLLNMCRFSGFPNGESTAWGIYLGIFCCLILSFSKVTHLLSVISNDVQWFSHRPLVNKQFALEITIPKDK